MKIRNILFSQIFILLIFLSASSQSTFVKTVILKISNVEISQYEFEKNLNKFRNEFQQKYNKPLPEDTLRTWINYFINDAFILAEAYNTGYLDAQEIKAREAFMVRKMLTKYRGPLYNEIVMKNIQIEPQMVENAYEKRKTRFEFSCLKFIDHETMLRILGHDTLLSNKQSFNQAVAKCKDYKTIQFKKMIFQWPNPVFWKIQKQMYQMKEGDISKPLYADDGIYIIHIERKQKIKIKPLENLKCFLKRLLERIEEKRLMTNYNSYIYRLAKININNSICNDLMERSKKEEKEAYFAKELYKDILKRIILSYSIDGKTTNINVDEFIDYYHNRLVRKALKNKKKLCEYLKELVFEDFAFRESLSRGLHKKRKFILDRKNYKNKLILSKFIKNEIEKHIVVSDDEVEREYLNRLNLFKGNEFAKISENGAWVKPINDVKTYIKNILIREKTALQKSKLISMKALDFRNVTN